MSGYANIIGAVRSQVWAIQPEKLKAILGFLQIKAQGGAPAADVLASIKREAAETRTRAEALSKIVAMDWADDRDAESDRPRAAAVGATGGGTIAVIPIYGLILYRGSSMWDISGPTATSVQKLTQQFRQALNDPNVKAIVFDVASPGGTVEGVDELAAEIRAAKGKKTIAVSNCLMASAAYYIASACDEIVASPSSLTGSVGVYCAHEDDSVYLENLGVKISLISYGENKTLGNSYEPLSDAARGNMQDMVDQFGAMFDKAVGKGRKMSADAVHKTFGQGLCFTAAKAVKIGMVDSVGTLDDVLSRYGAGPGASSNVRQSRMRAAASPAKADGGMECDCECDPCTDDNCDGCTVEQCEAKGCTCAAAKAKASHRAMRVRLELAAI